MSFSRKVFFIILISIFSLSSCSTQKETAFSQSDLVTPVSTKGSVKKKTDQQQVNDIKETVLSFRELYDAKIVKGDKDVLVAIKVRHLNRFRIKEIEKKVKDKLEKTYKEENFTVSSDFKIFLETSRLQEKAENDSMSKDEINKKLAKIIKLSKEKT